MSVMNPFRLSANSLAVAVLFCTTILTQGGFLLGQAAKYVSHPPQRPLPEMPNRPLGKGPAWFVDAAKGNDSDKGIKDAPWKTINHALARLSPGDTLYLRGGVYFENVYCSVVGRKDAPITIRSYPGERVVIDGGIREFQETTQSAWQPCPGGVPGEYRSAKPYKNIRDVIGRFGDSMVGLQTYWHAMDLRATNELWIKDPDEKIMVKPVYCGPGIWYDRESGYIHVRLAHTNLENRRIANYRGETDPRKLPLVIAPFRSVPLFVDLAKHVRFQDLIIRGGGYNAVVLQFGAKLEFDNVIIFCGSYGLRARNTGPLRFVHSALYGMLPPWAFRTENGLRTYTPRYHDPFLKDAVPEDNFPYPDHSPKNRRSLYGRNESFVPNARNIARLPSHALLVTEVGWESSVFYYPYNHDWEIAYSEFTDSHDGVYLSGRNLRFHHNWVDHIHDDGIYYSSSNRFVSDQVHFYQNLITRSLMGFSMHSRGGPGGNIYIYRNIVDLRQGVQSARPTPANPKGAIQSYHVVGTHGTPFLGVESLYFYQNTFISPAYRWGFAHRTLDWTDETALRRSFNNICVYLNAYPRCRLLLAKKVPDRDIQCDGNVHWCPVPGAEAPADYLDVIRNSGISLKNKESYPPGWAANSVVADPRFRQFDPSPTKDNDYRLLKDSPAVGKGVALPADWHDPLRPQGGARPDVGAIPLDGEPLKVGIRARRLAGMAE